MEKSDKDEMMQSPVHTARDFFDVVIVPDVEDAQANPHNVRLLFHALISLHQMNDWYFNASRYTEVIHPRGDVRSLSEGRGCKHAQGDVYSRIFGQA